MIGAGEENAVMSGIDVEIVQEIARRMDMRVEYLKCTWARCLELMKTGEADLLSSAYKKPDREAYLLYFSQPFLERLPIAFYFLKGKNYSVSAYEDIYQFGSIGVLNGASYFERFDQDTRAKKFEVTSQDQLFPMLLAGRLEAIAGYVPTENFRIAVGGYRDQIERSAFEYQEQALVYMALSKKSPLAARFDQFDQINQQLLDEGFIARIIDSYYEKYR
jgi:polar amino acid transport system substrate-binding protein